MFPDWRMVGYCGHPGAAGQGRLGIGKPGDRVKEMEKRYAKPYGHDRPMLPTLELIAVTAHPSPGKDKLYRGRTSEEVIDRYLDVAVKHQGYLLLNIQPGRANFLDEVRALKRWLVRPDVGVALDPEWAVGKGQVPGKSYGSVSGKELDAVARWLATVVAEHQLPEKLMVYHQLHASIVTNESALKDHKGVALVKSVDGIGGRQAKTDTWTKLVKNTPKHVRMGFKLFYSEDTAAKQKLMTPKQVLALKPRPDYVMYE